MAKGNDVSHSFTDLMTSLAVIFILLLVATLNNAFNESDDAREDLRKEVVKELEAINLTLTEDPNDPYTQIINISEDRVKFDQVKSKKDLKQKVMEENIDFLKNLFKILIPALCTEPLQSKIESLIVEGHTDSEGNKLLGGVLRNINISQERAFSVMSVGFLAFEKKDATFTACLSKIASTVGRGSAQLKYNSKGHQDDALSRRVEVKIKVKSTSGVNSLLRKIERINE